jgi:ribokinase
VSGQIVLPAPVVATLRKTAIRARFLVIGSLNMDLILDAGAEPSDEGAVLVREVKTAVGGHAGNCASALAELGVAVSLLAAVGDDHNGDQLLADLRVRGINVSGVRTVPGQPTGQVVIPVFGEKHYMLLCRGANDLLRATDVRAALDGAYDAVVVFDPSREALLEIAREPGRSPLCWTPGGIYCSDPIARQLVPRCDVVFANRVESARLVYQIGTDNDLPARTELVTTLGSEGAAVRHHGREWTAPSRPVTVVDPTGAGDAFAAAYLLARLAGLTHEQRLAVANVSGALAVGAMGARAQLATVPDLLAALAPRSVPTG